MDIRSWQQGVDYTFSTRHTWRHGNGAEAARINCDHFSRLRGESFPLRKITRPLVVQVGIELEDEGASNGKINRVVSSISTVLKHLHADGLHKEVPKFPRRKEDEGRVQYLTQDEVHLLINMSKEVFERHDLADIIQFAAWTGMRQSEILKLRVMDIDFAGNRICVGGLAGVETKTMNCRSIPIHHSLSDLLAKRAHSCNGEKSKLFGSDWKNRDQLLRAFNKPLSLLKKPEGYCFHTLRHSFATWSAEAGVPIRTLMAICGWKRIETALRYAKATDKALVDAISAI